MDQFSTWRELSRPAIYVATMHRLAPLALLFAALPASTSSRAQDAAAALELLRSGDSQERAAGLQRLCAAGPAVGACAAAVAALLDDDVQVVRTAAVDTLLALRPDLAPAKKQL